MIISNLIQVVHDPNYIDEYLSVARKNNAIIKSLNRTRFEVQKRNNAHVHMYLWFTNLPRRKAEIGLPMYKQDPGGAIDGRANDKIICTNRRTGLIRGPDRYDHETAEVC